MLDFIFSCSLAAFIIGPIIGLISFRIFKFLNTNTKHYLITFLTVIVILGVVALFFKVSFINLKFDFVYFFVGYVSYCILVFLLFRNPFTIILGIIGLIPIGIGVFSSTIGILGLGFVLSDFVPEYECNITSNTLCRVTVFGNATTSSGGYYGSMLLQFPQTKPFLERKVVTERFETSNNIRLTPEQVCGKLKEKFILSESKNIIE